MVSVTFHLMRVNIIFSSVWVAEWPSFWKELLTRLTICSLCTLTICKFSYLAFWFLGADLGSDGFSSWSLHTFYFPLVVLKGHNGYNDDIIKHYNAIKR